jgi:threonine dehydrogenase-like Zn-dependent dehydrogenase
MSIQTLLFLALKNGAGGHHAVIRPLHKIVARAPGTCIMPSSTQEAPRLKAYANVAPGQAKLRDVPLPVPGRGQVRIKTAACAICATDLAMIAGWQRTGFPSIPGHEWSGSIDAVGPGGDEKLVGCPCVAENVLTDGGEIGFEHPGGYAEYLLTEQNRLHCLPAGFPMATATLIERLAVAVRGIGHLRVADANSALVFGDGPIGLLMVMPLRHASVTSITVAGGRDRRLALARELGATHTLN